MQFGNFFLKNFPISCWCVFVSWGGTFGASREVPSTNKKKLQNPILQNTKQQTYQERSTPPDKRKLVYFVVWITFITKSLIKQTQDSFGIIPFATANVLGADGDFEPPC